VLHTETGEIQERKLGSSNGEAERVLSTAITGIAWASTEREQQWLEDLAHGCGHTVWIGDAAQIRAKTIPKPCCNSSLNLR
jgi:hypothetical protein